MSRREILEKHWKNYLISVGLPYQPMSERAYEELEKAMEEYAEMRQKGAIGCVCSEEEKHGETSVMCCNHCGNPTENFWCKY
jgi:hypothetical protein